MSLEEFVRKVCDISFVFTELATAEFDSATPIISSLLHELLTDAPSYSRCPHHGVYNYDCSLGACNTIRIQKTGLFVIMHDGQRFDSHPLVTYLKSRLPNMFPDVQFQSTD